MKAFRSRTGVAVTATVAVLALAALSTVAVAAVVGGFHTSRGAARSSELVCNLPGHYSAGVYTELDVA